ncbi:hypothetical protein [Streptomyces sp. NPDC102462]|uniref:hypothetical protein n=1 Tax=Streptomyces sp. NPDC102462 TaxID=3366178 RepID=UPI0037F78C11
MAGAISRAAHLVRLLDSADLPGGNGASAFDAHAAETLVRKAVAELDAELPVAAPTEVTPVASWPPFRLAEDEQPAAALLTAAADAGLTVRAKTAGPSNIGNLLHGIDERAHLAELPTVSHISPRNRLTDEGRPLLHFRRPCERARRWYP